MSNKQREEFEELWQTKILDAGWTLSKTESYFVWKRAWASAIASLVVKLPDICDLQPSIMMRKDVMNALDKAGIRYE